MNLHESPSLFSEGIRATAQQMGILDIYVEKDYWVTKALHLIFSDPIGAEVVFKGGTALSKCYGLIERFSEDIDLVVLNSVLLWECLPYEYPPLLCSADPSARLALPRIVFLGWP